MRFSRRQLQIVIGLLWFVDGLLQLQPFMFSTAFAHEILAPAGDGQPGWVAAPVRYFADYFALHPVLLNSSAAAFQLTLGVGFLFRRTVRIAICACIAWSVGIWWFGEGLGGLASAHASLITGAPGAAILYGLLAAASWPVDRTPQPAPSRAPARWLTRAWTPIWIGGAVLQLLPAQSNPKALIAQIRGGAGGAPRWLAATDNAAAKLITHLGVGGLIALAAFMTAIGLGALVPGRVRTTAAGAGAGLAALFWLVGQNLGELYTGQATDPNSGVLLILLAVAIAGPVPGTRAANMPHARPAPHPGTRARAVHPPPSPASAAHASLRS